tara:strand:+ start:1052 stop:1390 length:339 start_codon:yes stop_codon:yes gene_type:complete
MNKNIEGIRTELKKTFGGRFVSLVYLTLNGEIKTYHGKFEGKEKDFTNKVDRTAKDNIVFDVYEKLGKSPTLRGKRQLRVDRIQSISDSHNTVILNLEYRPHLVSTTAMRRA